MTELSNDPPVRRIYKFLLAVTICWLAILPLWLYFFSPIYGHFLSICANPLIGKNLLNDNEVVYEYLHPCVKGNIYFDVTSVADGRVGRGNLRFSMDGERFQFKLTIWLALMLATPIKGGWGKRMLAFIICWAALLLCQELDLFLQTQDQKLDYWRGLANQGKFLPPGTLDYVLGFAGKYFLQVGYVVVPIVIWLPVGITGLKPQIAPEVNSSPVLTNG